MTMPCEPLPLVLMTAIFLITPLLYLMLYYLFLASRGVERARKMGFIAMNLSYIPMMTLLSLFHLYCRGDQRAALITFLLIPIPSLVYFLSGRRKPNEQME